MTFFSRLSRVTGVAAVAFSFTLLGACGGGGGGGSSSGGNPPPPPAAQGTISGTATKGPVAGATVSAYAISGGSPGAKIASATTDAAGHFTLAMGTYAGSVMLQMAGGTYTDEATTGTMPMAPGDVMTVAMPAMAAGAKLDGVQITPLTSMAQAMAQHMSGGMTDANLASAHSAVGHYFMITDIVHAAPMDPLVTGSGNAASQDAINYGMVLAGMSQLAQAQGMTSSSAMVTAMTSDAMDAVMDGMMSGGAVMMAGMGMMPATMGTTGLATAMNEFMTSARNRSGVAAASVQTLMSQLNGSNGQMLPGGTGTAPNATISGHVFNGAMTGASVMAFALTGGTMGMQLAVAPTDASGAFMLSLGGYAGPVMLQVSHGTYVDEATGATVTMGASDTMTAVMSSIVAGSHMTGVWVTPLTSMAQARAQGMSGGMVDSNITAANMALGAYFMVDDILQTMPINPMTPGSGTPATPAQRNCGITLAAMAEYARAAGTTPAAFVTAMMGDATDGMMNGRMGGTQITMGGMMGSGGMGGGGMMQSTAGTSGLATAMTDYMGSSMNHSGLTAADMNLLIQKLAASNGQL